MLKNYVNKYVSLHMIIFLLLATCVVSEPVFAAGGLNNLNKATNALEEIKTWLFRFTGVGALIYIVYLVAMTFAEKKTWNDVLMGLGYCAGAGGVIMAGNWALSLWS